MKPAYIVQATAVALLLITAACTKNTETDAGTLPGTVNPASGAPGSGSGISLNKVFRELRSTPETKCVTAGKLQTVTFAKGTRLTFYPNSFRDGAGNTITTGTVCLEVVEMYKPGDMIANRATTMSGSSLLMSRGQISISATRNGEKIYANKYGIGFKQSVSSIQPMLLYFGNIDNKDSVLSWGNPMTAYGMSAPATSDSAGVVTESATSGIPGTFYYQFDSCTDFTWINCDYFYGSAASKTSVTVAVADVEATASNTQVFIVFPSINAVASLYVFSTSPLKYKTPDIPEGLTASIVIMTKKNGHDYFYYENTGFTITTLLNITAATTPQTISYIQGRLAAL